MNTPINTPVCATSPEISPCALVGRSTLTDLLRMLGSDALSASDVEPTASRMPVSLRRVPAGAQLVHMGAPTDALFFVCTGTFKIFRTDEDGYEQVLAFAGRREVLAFDALCMDHHPTAASALEDSTVYVIHKADLPAFSRAVPAFERELQRAGSRALTRTNELVDVMAAVAAEVRLARFLLQLSRQMAASGQSPRRFHLRMGRRDIASMLGVAHETVSRSFTALAMACLIHVSDRDVEILDMDGLRAYSRSTRRSLDDVGHPGGRRQTTQRASGCAPMGLRPLAA
ncbi:Crp/Fnr family transcriptional regulator [Hydrogenophaga sp. PBL-H3]|uniref:Crp/Fnr family transcriptional regulator n=1 Tax=Hydrogenophaga sp. PBL-H3 TaxID=434010 RepID=UPI00131F9304|nr:Crp/Fnr family transcriptional regulator [Hydrogenophaga sp. PBL-H3]QHE76172.1 Crp/Fnr family transcriptional regulator [Hydrogenophaga sp. PBL-H3]QHE80596.1 Crp/Fnr family transcriptional regulator [Hydrogenophaga sp. PBL-H3]